MFKWKEGRQGTGYYKMKLFESKLLKLDVYILKMPPRSHVPLHTDPVKGYKHHRFNFILQNAEIGGYLRLYWNLDDEEVWITNRKPRYQYFRPDTQKHAVTLIEGSKSRYVLSIGWLTK